MDTSPEKLSNVWWKGTLKGGLKGLMVGLLVGAAAALTLQFVLIPLFPAIAEAFAGFLTLTPSAAAGWAGGVVPLASFSAIPLAIFSGVSGMLGNLLGSGNDAVNAYKQDVEHRMNEMRISQIESREMALEQIIPSPSRSVQKIIAAGPRNTASFQSAEEQRAQTPTTPTIH
ncbi:MAG: hypothetical protein K2X09_08370 [Rickettsiales bacterium]|nr:hypothetical protein [Rickettsiales bacterium]